MIENSEIISALKTFSPEEIERLKLFVSSEYIVPIRRYRKLYSEILKHSPDYKIEREEIFGKLKLAKSYEDSTARNYFSAFGKTIIDFIAHEKLIKDTSRKKIYFLESASERGSEKYTSKIIKEFAGKLHSSDEIDEQSFYMRYEIGLAYFNKSYSEDKTLRHSKEEMLDCLDDVTANIFTYFFSIANDIYMNMLTFGRNVKFEKEKTLIFKLMNALHRNMEEIVPQSYILHNRFLKLQNALIRAFDDLHNHEKYNELEKLISSSEENLSVDEAYHFYIFLSACCVFKNQEGMDYGGKLMEIYKKIIEKKYFPRSLGYKLNPELYRNIVIHSMKMKEFIWVKKFIDDTSKYVSHPLKTDLRNFGKSMFYFEKGSYSKAMKYAERINKDYFILKYDVKNILIKSYSELNLQEKALEIIDSYRHMLYRDKIITEDRKKRSRVFLNYIEKIIKNYDNKFELEFIASKIDKEKLIAHKEWMNEFIFSLIEEIKSVV